MTTFEDLIANVAASNAARGTGVRCPVCNAGIGKFCLKPGVTVHRSADDITVHPERVALQNFGPVISDDQNFGG